MSTTVSGPLAFHPPSRAQDGNSHRHRCPSSSEGNAQRHGHGQRQSTTQSQPSSQPNNTPDATVNGTTVDPMTSSKLHESTVSRATPAMFISSPSGRPLGVNNTTTSSPADPNGDTSSTHETLAMPWNTSKRTFTERKGDDSSTDGEIRQARAKQPRRITAEMLMVPRKSRRERTPKARRVSTAGDSA